MRPGSHACRPASSGQPLEPGACGSAFGHSGGGAGFKTDVLVSADGKRVAVLLMNCRAGSAGDDRAHRAIWQLYCAG